MASWCFACGRYHWAGACALNPDRELPGSLSRAVYDQGGVLPPGLAVLVNRTGEADRFAEVGT